MNFLISGSIAGVFLVLFSLFLISFTLVLLFDVKDGKDVKNSTVFQFVFVGNWIYVGLYIAALLGALFSIAYFYPLIKLKVDYENSMGLKPAEEQPFV